MSRLDASWLANGVKHVTKNSAVFLGRDGATPMDILGIGANMVKSLRDLFNEDGNSPCTEVQAF